MTERKRKDPEQVVRVPNYAGRKSVGQFLEDSRMIGAMCDDPAWPVLMGYFEQRLFFEMKHVACAKDFKFWQGALAARTLLADTIHQVLSAAKKKIDGGEARGGEIPETLEASSLARVLYRWKDEQAKSEQA